MTSPSPAIADAAAGSMSARFGWHADSYDPSLASIRYRLIEPLAALRTAGVGIERYDPTRGPAGYDALLFSKSHSVQAVAIAEAMRTAGKPVVYDICDNLFAAHAVGHVSAARVARVRRMLALATHLTFSTARLAEQLNATVEGLTARQWTIPDALDIAPRPAAPPARWRDRHALAAAERFLARHAGALHCVWFGKSLGKASGYVHLEAATRELEAFAAAHPVTLTVISNEMLRFRLASRRWRVPVHYIPWRLQTARAAIGLHRVAVIPVESNDYTAGKTINRPATALLEGLGVVADAIPSYEELRPFIALGGWQEGLRYYASWPDGAHDRIAAGRAFLTERYSPASVARQWAGVLATL